MNRLNCKSCTTLAATDCTFVHAGDSLNFGDVLAANPDWADQHADQSMEAAAAAGGVQRLDADRNPGGGAEPTYDGIPHTLRQQISDRSLLDEALKLTA